ncbi:MAG: CRISPR-associated endonuclease Cas2 [Blastocatellia bacterium]|jgi:CRISPR-associated protein Cas2
MRIRYIVTYDISDQKRLRRVFRTMKGYGDPLQYSVFQCDLSASERILMVEALSAIINQREDQVMLINIGPAENRGRQSVETLGRALPQGEIDRIAVIV